MTRKNAIKAMLIWGMFFLAFGGWLLHLKIHSPLAAGYGFIPLIAGIISVFILPPLFWFRATIAYAYVINGFTVILGTIVMAHFSIAKFSGPASLSSILFGTLLADIAILWGKFAMGKALFDLEFLRSDQDPVPGGRYFWYPNMGWWWVHLLGWSVVYALGALFWK